MCVNAWTWCNVCTWCRLPVAHTCGFQLDLPKYASKEVLRHKLLQAVEHVDFQIA